MKTAISLPDRLFEDAERTAKAMGLARSQLFARALEEFIERHQKETITEQLNAVYEADSIAANPAYEAASLEGMRELTRHDAW